MRTPKPAFRRILRRIGDLRRERAGSILLTFGLALPVIVGVVGLGVESGAWYLNKRSQQTEADAAARSGAYERARGEPGNVSSAALHDALLNGYVNAAPNTITINNPPTSGAYAGKGNAVEVILSTQKAALLTGMFLPSVTIRSRAVAAVEVTGSACVLALDPTLSGAVTNQGTANIDMPGCTIAANSSSASAIDIGGGSTLTADSLWTTGNYNFSGAAAMELTKQPTVNAWALDNPYGDTTIPSLTSCDQNNASYSGGSFTLNPGVYCNGINFGSNSTVTLNPGTYYINAGNLTMSATTYVRCNCTLPGQGVTFVLTSTSGAASIGTATINGGANVQLNAPSDSSDPYKGLIIYQDPRAPTNGVDKLTGGANMSLTGSVYFSTQVVRWSGNNGPLAPTCTQVVGDQVVFIGNSTIQNTGCPAAGVQPVTIKGVRVVE